MVGNKILKINIGTIIKNPEKLRFISDHFKTKKLRKNAVKKLPFVIKYVPDQYKTKKLFNKVIIKIFGTLGLVPDSCDKAVDNYSHALGFIPNCYRPKNV